MPPLKNLKHEKFARALLDSPNQTQAYAVTYNVDNTPIACASSSRLLSNVNVRQRVIDLLEQRKAGLTRVSERLKDHLESQTESISLDTCKTILKVAGAYDEDKSSPVDNITVQIVNLCQP